MHYTLNSAGVLLAPFKLHWYLTFIVSLVHWNAFSYGAIVGQLGKSVVNPMLTSASVKEPGGCALFEPTKGLKKEFVSTVPSWYVTLASKHYYSSWGEKILKRPMQGIDQPNMCLKVLFLSPVHKQGREHFTVIVGGFNTAVHQRCIRIEKALSQKCQPAEDLRPGALPTGSVKTSTTEETIIAHGINGDYIILGRCGVWQGPGSSGTPGRSEWKDWAVLTPDWRPLNLTMKVEIEAVLLKYDFNGTNIESMDYSRCSHKTGRIAMSQSTGQQDLGWRVGRRKSGGGGGFGGGGGGGGGGGNFLKVADSFKIPYKRG